MITALLQPPALLSSQSVVILFKAQVVASAHLARGQCEVSVLSPKYYLLATCLRPLHRHHKESSSNEMVSYTLRPLSCRKGSQDILQAGDWVDPV